MIAMLNLRDYWHSLDPRDRGRYIFIAVCGFLVALGVALYLAGLVA